MIAKLKQDETELQILIKEWEKYDASNNKHYNIPFPYEIKAMRSSISRPDNKKSYIQLKGLLSYFNVVCDYYDDNDYVVDVFHCTNNFESENELKKVKITDKHREIIMDIIMGIEEMLKEKEAKK
jgi:hypothetical protein